MNRTYFHSDASIDEPIAIVGIGCRFPGGAVGPKGFWEGLKRDFDAIEPLPDHRRKLFKHVQNSDDLPGVPANAVGGLLCDIDQFDSKFFKIAPRVAAKMDPQQRIFLEVGYETILDAGLSLDSIRSSRVGVYLGVTSSDYGSLLAKGNAHQDLHLVTGASRHAIAGRFSHFFNLDGPCVTIDTSTSSSLTAVHQASESLRHNECDIALCGGVHLIVDPNQLNVFFNQGYQSKVARCRFGDAAASGPVLSEGVGVVALKRLSRAFEDDDRIYATLLGSVSEHDGRYTESFGTPSVEAQVSLLRNCYEVSDVPLDEVAYIECHGTGTPVGDRAEIQSIINTFSNHRSSSNPLLIGSVKTNIGHMNAAAGIAGLIKSALCLFHRELPASLHCSDPIDILAANSAVLELNRRRHRWTNTGDPRIFGVTSLSLCGSNVHVVLAENCYQDSAEDGTKALPQWQHQSHWFDPFAKPTNNTEDRQPTMVADSELSIRDWVASVIRNTIDVDDDDLPLDIPLLQLGIDSILATEIQAAMSDGKYPLQPDIEYLMDASIQDIATWVEEKFLLIAKVIPDQQSGKPEAIHSRQLFNEF